MRISISTARIVRFVVPIITVFLLSSLAGQVWQRILGRSSGAWLVRALNVNEERNLPTFYQALTLLACCALLALIASRVHALGRRNAVQWWGLSSIFLLLACDEAFRLHERLGQFRDHLPGEIGRTFQSGWVIFGLLFAAIVGAAYARFIIQLPSRVRTLFIIAGFLFVMGAAGMEIVAGSSSEATGAHPFRYQLLATVEEAMEMSGVAIFLCALVAYLASLPDPVVRFEFSFTHPPARVPFTESTGDPLANDDDRPRAMRLHTPETGSLRSHSEAGVRTS